MSKEFKKLTTTILITAIVFMSLGILAVKFADNTEVKVVKEYNTNLDYLINSDNKYIKVAKTNTFYGIQHNAYRLYIVDINGNLVREWYYFTD